MARPGGCNRPTHVAGRGSTFTSDGAAVRSTSILQVAQPASPLVIGSEKGGPGVKIAVFGLGYVGSVSAACLAARGHDVVGVDVNPLKTRPLNEGRSPVAEPGLGELTEKAVADGRLTATEDGEAAVRDTDASLICVGTPSRPTAASTRTLSSARWPRSAEALAGTTRRHTVIVRSTTLPGTSETIVAPLLEETSSLVAGRDFGFAVNPGVPARRRIGRRLLEPCEDRDRRTRHRQR